MHTTYCEQYEQVKLSMCTLCAHSCNHKRVCMCLCIYDRGGSFCWMSHIVPVQLSDSAGGQRGMEPERGDSDK